MSIHRGLGRCSITPELHRGSTTAKRASCVSTVDQGLIAYMTGQDKGMASTEDHGCQQSPGRSSDMPSRRIVAKGQAGCRSVDPGPESTRGQWRIDRRCLVAWCHPQRQDLTFHWPPPPVSSDGRRAASQFFCQERSRKLADWLAFLRP